MKANIDTKSALIGLAAGIIVMLAVGAGSDPNPVGHYQITGTANHALIIDTKTGKVWRGYLPPGEGVTDGDFFKVKIADKYDAVK